jgi:hypothetical protein
MVSNSGNHWSLKRLKKTDAELNQLLEGIEKSLHECAKLRRDLNPELQTTGEKVHFSLDFEIRLDGSINELETRKSLGSAPLPDCARAITKIVESYKFSPIEGDTKKSKTIPIHVPFQMIVLTDTEAQGRGFQYLAAEGTWEQSLRKNPQWFSCKRAEDCAITFEMCEVRAVNKNFEKDYIAAVTKRQRERSVCREPDRPQVLSPVCRAGRCATATHAASPPRG